MGAPQEQHRCFDTLQSEAYSKGAKVSHNGKKWTSDSDGNVWEPGVYGWTEYVETAAASEAAQEPAGDPVGEPGE